MLQGLSKKIFGFSLLFLILNATWVWFLVESQNETRVQNIAPHLVLREGESARVKDSFENEAGTAKDGLTLFAGTEITTSEKGGASLILNQNVVRMAANTQLIYTENRLKSTGESLLRFQLKQGKVWIMARESIEINSPRVTTLWQQSAGDYAYEGGKVRLTVAEGMTELTLKDEKGDVLVEASIPVYSQVSFAESQFVAEYKTLQYSKLKKELRMMSINLWGSPWIAQNLKKDALFLAQQKEAVLGQISQQMDHRSLSRWMHRLVLIQNKKTELAQNQILNYISSLLNELDEAKRQEGLITLQEDLATLVPSDDFVQEIKNRLVRWQPFQFSDPAVEQVYGILRDDLLTKGIQGSSASLLLDFNGWLKNNEKEKALKVLSAWLDYWKMRDDKSAATLEKESRLLHSIILGNIRSITPALLNRVDALGKLRLKAAGEDQETFLSILRERIETAGLLVSIYRYRDAKDYLQSSYNSLKTISEKEGMAARKLFEEEAKSILQRVDYADKILHNEPRPIDDSDFQIYLKEQEKSAELAHVVQSFLEDPSRQGPSSQDEIQDALQKFSAAGIQVIPQDIQESPDNNSVLIVKKAYLAQYDQGTVIDFSARYDVQSDAFYDIELSDRKIRGGYLRKDLVRILPQASEQVKTDGGTDTVVDTEALPLLTPKEFQEQNKQRTQILNRDVAILYVMRDLNKYNIYIGDAKQVVPLDPDLIRFHIEGASLDATSASKTIDFDYDLEKKLLSAIQVQENPEVTFGFYPLAEAAKQINERIRVTTVP